MILLPRIPEAYLSYIACLKAGLVVIPGSEMLRASDIAYRLRHSGAKAVIAHASLAERVEEAEKQSQSLHSRLIHGEERDGWKPLLSLNGSALTELPETTEEDMAFCLTHREPPAIPKV